MARVLDIGGTGLLGQYIGQEALRRGHDVIATHRGRQAPDDKRIDWHRLDIRDSSAVEALVRSVAPNLVLNAAAMTDVDACEGDPDEAKYVNETAAGQLASVSNEVGAAFVHISTDYVFDGTGPAKEDTEPHPLNTYGGTKLFGERVVRQAHPDSIVLRLSSVFGWNRLSSKTNAVTWILQKLEAGQEVPLFHDQKVTPSYAKTAAEVAFDLWDRHTSGLFHVSCPDCASRVEMGRAVADVFQISNPRLHPISLRSVALRAKRPLAPCLVVRKVEETLKRPMPTFRACLEDMKATR
ncbi:MAG TPA: SDR family oxidoreductase [Thermoplasmata archaeon]|nr:SDR family oxidoreductase [Thermoplasmata archaeon]